MSEEHPNPPVQPAPPRQKPYVFPPELKPYRPFLAHAGREEELMNSKATPFNNWPVYSLASAMSGQIGLLTRLHQAGLLRPADEAKPVSQEES